MDYKVSKNTSQCQYFQLEVLLNFFSIARVLQQLLLKSLILSGRSHQNIPLYRLKNRYIVYRSAIAFKLGRAQNLSPVDLARQLVNFLPKVDPKVKEVAILEFTVRIIHPGWIDFQLSDRSLTVWLMHLPKFAPNFASLSAQSNQIKTNLFPIEYAHARCCSLLRLAHEQGAIELNLPQQLNTPLWQWLQPDPIPWLNGNEESLHFQLVHPTEQNLIAQLLAVVDADRNTSTEEWLKLATNLSNAMLDFDRSCRIWGEVMRETPTLAQARLGLIAVTQFLLRGILQDCIGVCPVVEL